MEKTLSPEDYDFFQNYIFEMDDVLELFLGRVDPGLGRLDYSIKSLSFIEGLFYSVDFAADDVINVNRCARYLGEVFRRNLGGYWSLCDDDPKNAYYGIPVITGFSEVDVDFCPLAIIDNFVYSRRRGLLVGAVMANAEFAKR